MTSEPLEETLPSQEIVTKDAYKFVAQHLRKKAEDIEDSPEQVRERILEHLAKSDKRIRALLHKANVAAANQAKAMLKRPPLPAALKRADLPAIATNEYVAPRGEFAGDLPRLISIHGLLDPVALRGASLGDLWDALTVPAVRASGFPIWGDPQWSHSNQVYWSQWTSTSAFRAMCLAGCVGRGVWQDEMLTNTARWRWMFTPRASEPLQIFTSHGISGPCAWRSGGGHVSLWLLAETTVEKYVSGQGWQRVGFEDRSIRKLFSSNSGLAMNGPPPQGYFGGSSGSKVSFSGTDNGVAIAAEAGRLFTIGVDVTLALTANMNAAIAVGELAGSSLELCRLEAPSCTICRTG
jgi:hypothetical protein